MTNRVLAGWAAVLLGAAGLTGASSCSESSEPRRSGGGGAATGGAATITTVAGPAAGSTSQSTTTGGGGDEQIPPDGWVAWDGWSETCVLYYPPTPELLPAPFAWAPCSTAPPGMACQVMVTDWTDIGTGTMSLFPSFSVWNGTAYLLMRRLTPAYFLEIVGEIDGPLRNALMRVASPTDTSSKIGCSTQLSDLDEGKWVVRTQGHDPLGDSLESPHNGAVGGTVGVLEPTVLAHYIDSITYSFQVSESLVLRIGQPYSIVTVFPWSLGPDVHVTSPPDDPESFSASQIEISGATVFYSTVTGYAHGINVWTEAAGAQPFVRFIGDYTRGAADIGTDGTDLVWGQGEGKATAEYHYPTRHIMTAPFTSDPAALSPRRLRSAAYTNIGNYAWQVGCGRAAHQSPPNGIMVVRVSDGVSWFIGSEQSFRLLKPLGLTCDELFVLGTFDGKNSIARIRLDSLGAGTPPD